MARLTTAEAHAGAVATALLALAAFDATALDYRLQVDANCSAPATAIRDYPLAFTLPREVLFLSENASVRLTGGQALGEPLVVDAQQIGRFSSTDPTMAVQAGRFGVARITAATAAVCQTTPWSVRFDYAIGPDADIASVTVERGVQRILAITDAGKQRFAGRLASSPNGIFSALLGPEQRWARDLLARSMDLGVIEAFRNNFCPACTDQDVRWFAEHFSKYIEKVGPGGLWTKDIDTQIAVAYAFPELPPSAPPIRSGEDVSDDPFQGALIPPTTLKDLMASSELGWQLSASDPRAFSPADASVWLVNHSWRFPEAKTKPLIGLLDKACVESMRRTLGKPDSALLASLCTRQATRGSDDLFSGLPEARRHPHPARLIDITLPAHNDQPKVVLRFWRRDGAIYLYNVKGLPL